VAACFTAGRRPPETPGRSTERCLGPLRHAFEKFRSSERLDTYASMKYSQREWKTGIAAGWCESGSSATRCRSTQVHRYHLIYSDVELDLDKFATYVYLSDRIRPWLFRDDTRYQYTSRTCIYLPYTIARCTMTSRLASDGQLANLDGHVALLEVRQGCFQLPD
jgi:hypothetical protein